MSESIIIDHLGDELSRQWFERRLDVLNGKRGVLDFTEGLPLPDVREFTQFRVFYESFGSNPDIYILGTDEYSRFSARTLAHSAYKGRVKGFVTHAAFGEGQLEGLPVHLIEEVSKKENSVFLTGGKDKATQADNYLLLNRYWINQKNIFLTTEFLKAICGVQYFDLPAPACDEVFVDCGCYDFATSIDFMQWCCGNSSRIVAFEPDNVSAQVCRQRAHSLAVPAEIIEAGAYNTDSTASFTPFHSGGSRFLADGTSRVATVRIDDVLKGDRATFIKMDIEGTESEALRGAEETIRKWKPTLAISVYHKKDDVLNLPELILSFADDYTLYLRHYSNSMAETVLYAIPKDREVRKTPGSVW